MHSPAYILAFAVLLSSAFASPTPQRGNNNNFANDRAEFLDAVERLQGTFFDAEPGTQVFSNGAGQCVTTGSSRTVKCQDNSGVDF